MPTRLHGALRRMDPQDRRQDNHPPPHPRRARRIPAPVRQREKTPRPAQRAPGPHPRDHRARRHAEPATGATSSRKRGLSPLNLWAAHPPPPFGQVIPKREDLTRNDLGFVRPRSSLGGFLPMFARRLLVSLD